MKKVLMGTSALVAATVMASGSALAADPIKLGVGGYMQTHIGFVSLDSDDHGGQARDQQGVDILRDTEVFFKGSTKLDNGIEVGADIQLEGSTSGDQIDESYMWISSDTMGQIIFGSENLPNYKMSITGPTTGIGINSGDATAWFGNPTGIAAVTSTGAAATTTSFFNSPLGTTANRFGADDAEMISYYTPRFAGLQLGLGYARDDSQDASPGGETGGNQHAFSGGLGYTEDFGGVGVKLGLGIIHWGERTGGDHSWNAGLQVSFGGFTVGGSGSRSSGASANSGHSYDAGVKYATGPYSVSVQYFHGETEGASAITAANDEADLAEVAVRYQVGPGISWVGSVMWADITGEDDGDDDDVEGVGVITGFDLSF